MSDLVIQYPKNDGDKIFTTSATYPLIAFGKDAKLKSDKTANTITTATLASTDATYGPVDGKIRKQPIHWAVVFPDVPVDTTKTYKIHVEDAAGNKADRTFQFTNVKPAEPRGKLHIFSVTPGAPLSGATVDGSGFYVTGNTDPDVAVYAIIYQAGCNPYFGSLINMPPNYIFYFQSVPAGDGYTLVVTEFTNPQQSDTENDITVT